METFQGIPALITTLILVGLVIGVGVYTLSEVTYSTKTALLVRNETITASNSTYVNVAYPRISSVILVHNVSLAKSSNYSGVIPLANISHNQLGIKVLDNRFNGLQVNVTYNGQANSTASTALSKATAAVTTIPTWLTIIIVVAMAAIILTIIMGSFGGRQR